MPLRTTSDPKKTRRVTEFLSLGFKDYIGARTLLIEALCLQGAILASTAVEKYLKAVLALRGNATKGHLGRAVLNSVANYDPGLFASLNRSFLAFLKRCYELRYFDSIRPGFNLVIAAPQVLAELDVTVANVEGRFNLTRSDGTVLTTPYAAAVASRLPRLYDRNCVLQGVDKRLFVEGLSTMHCYEMRLLDTGGLVEVEYVSGKGRWDDDFLAEALTPGPRKGA